MCVLGNLPLATHVCSLLGHILATICPTKKGRDAVRRRWRMRGNLYTSKRARLLQNRTLARLRQKAQHGTPLKVAFAMMQPAKWNDALWQAITSCPKLQGQIIYLHSNLSDPDCSDDLLFFRTIDPACRSLPRDQLVKAVQSEEVDILFFQEPFLGAKEMLQLSQYVLPSYVHYTFSLRDTGGYYYTSEFVATLWRFFCETPATRQEILYYSVLPPEAVISVGWPKLSVYRKPIKNCDPLWRGGSYRVIYAPSFSFKGYGAHGCFDQLYSSILTLAKSTPEISWIFMPHPAMRRNIGRSGFMTKDTYDAYLEQWREIGTVWTSGNYFDIFRSSHCLITDGESFLGEYLPTGHAVIDLNCASEIPFAPLGQQIRSAYYPASSITEISHLLNQLQQGEDPKSAQRKALINLLLPSTGPDPSQRVVELLQKAILPQKESNPLPAKS